MQQSSNYPLASSKELKPPQYSYAVYAILTGVILCYILSIFVLSAIMMVIVHAQEDALSIIGYNIFLIIPAVIYPLIIAIMGTISLAGLSRRKKWGRSWGIAAGFIGLGLFPGTFICIIALYFLTHKDVVEFLDHPDSWKPGSNWP